MLRKELELLEKEIAEGPHGYEAIIKIFSYIKLVKNKEKRLMLLVEMNELENEKAESDLKLVEIIESLKKMNFNANDLKSGWFI